MTTSTGTKSSSKIIVTQKGYEEQLLLQPKGIRQQQQLGAITIALLEEAKQSRLKSQVQTRISLQSQSKYVDYHWELFPPRPLDFCELFVPGAPVWVLMDGKPFSKAVIIGKANDDSKFSGRFLVQYKDNTQYHCRPGRLCRIYGATVPLLNNEQPSVNRWNLDIPSSGLKIQESSNEAISSLETPRSLLDSEKIDVHQTSSCTIVVCPETSHYRQLARLLPFPGEKALEIGSDLGACTSLLWNSVTVDGASGRAIGIDKSSKSVEEAKKRFPFIPFHCVDVLTSQNENNLGIPGETSDLDFDVIFVDINGNRMIDSVAEVISITRSCFSPRLIVCKSTQMTSALTMGIEEVTTRKKK